MNCSLTDLKSNLCCPIFGTVFMSVRTDKGAVHNKIFLGTVYMGLYISVWVTKSEQPTWFQIERGGTFFNSKLTFKATGLVDGV